VLSIIGSETVNVSHFASIFHAWYRPGKCDSQISTHSQVHDSPPSPAAESIARTKLFVILHSKQFLQQLPPVAAVAIT
jgi:hypothetical protein